MRVFIGKHEVAGYFKSLKIGFDKINVRADFVQLNEHKFYGSNNIKYQYFTRLWRLSWFYRNKTDKKDLIKKSFFIILNELLNFLFVIRSVFVYKVFIFSYGETISNRIYEFWLYKLLGKKTIFVFLGSDSRPPYMAAKYINDELEVNYEVLSKTTLSQKNKIKRIEKFSDFCINWGPYGQFHEKNFINVVNLGLPLNIKPVQINDSKHKIVKILHTPSDSAIKGTKYILNALDILKKEGILFDLNLLSNVTNDEVLDAITNCDFIIDCRFSDTPIGMFGAEAALLGKPTIVGGYLHNNIEKYFSDIESIPPALYVHPNKIKQGIKKMIIDHEFRNSVAAKAFDFAKNNYTSRHVALNYMQIINGNFPRNWWFDPNKIDYFKGSISEKKLKEIVCRLVKEKGEESLQLSDKPKLEKSLLDFAFSKK